MTANRLRCVGTLDLEVPEFVTIKQDLENKTVSLGVEDANIARQKEMWGTFNLSGLCQLAGDQVHAW